MSVGSQTRRSPSPGTSKVSESISVFGVAETRTIGWRLSESKRMTVARRYVIPAQAGIEADGAGMQAGGRYAVYIMASRRNGTLYVGVTNNLAIRSHQHRTGGGSEFTRKYGVTQWVWYEFYSDINEAIAREKRIKKWERRWKLELIENFNPEWADLYEALNG